MASSTFKTTFRNLSREKMYAIINIAGLSLAIACCLILGIYLYNELTYDQHNKQYKKLYRVVNEFNVNGKLETFARTSQLLGPMLADDNVEIEGYVRVFLINRKVLLKNEDNAFYWEGTGFASSNFFDYFDHEFKFGSHETLKNERWVAVSEKFATKYWGDENPVGKTFTSEGYTAKITHVFYDLPANSHMKYNVIQSDAIPYFAEPEDANARRQLLTNVNWYTYLIMREDYDIQDFKEISDTFFERHMEELLRAAKITWRAWLQPMADIHYNSDIGYDEPTGNKNYLYGFAAVAIFILLVACINYMNLATARATKRAKEVGMQKILGSGRTRLVFQFMGEAVFFSLVALVFGYILIQVALTMTPINELLDNSIALKDLADPQVLAGMLIFSLVLGLISGIYPAFYLSSIAPVSALVGSHKAGKGSVRLREVLVLIQFMISVCVIACTLFMALQMRYVTNKPLGYEKENRLLITLRTADVIDKVPTLKKELLKNSSIMGVSLCNEVLGKISGLMAPMVDNNEGVQERTTVKVMAVGNDFVDVAGLELLEGRDFSKRLITDIGDSFIVNETMVKRMGWEQPLGKHINAGKVIGVVKDFHYDSLHNSVEPFVLQRHTGTQGAAAQNRDLLIYYLVVKLAGGNTFETLDFIEGKFAEFDPKHPFEYEFFDDYLDKLYFSEKRLMKLIGIFAAVCIFISCLGLFGLASFTTEQRKKEIAIRKVLGASTGQIINLLARNIQLLVLLGSVIASLIAYYAMDEWLADFAYRININKDLWVFLLSAVVAACVAFLTVALQSFRTASDNPINAIRYE
ncbi:FtsX-like permease family protein [Thermodesulfobacteriota bacterium]